MKKYFFILFIFLIMIISVNASSKNIKSLNSKDLLKYLEKQNINGKIVKVCNKDYCDYLKYKNLDKAVDVYIKNYENYIKEKIDEDTSIMISLKGFLITEISYH